MSEPADLQPLVNAFLADDRPALDGYMAGNGATLAGLIWNPALTDCPEQPLAHALSHWLAIRGDADLPPVSAVSPFDLRPALGFILLIDVIDDGRDGRFRLYGTKVAEMYGEDMTGRLVSEVGGNNYMTRLMRALYRAALLRRQAVFSHHLPPPHVSVTAWKRLILPLTGPDGAVIRFLSVNLPGAWRPAPMQRRPLPMEDGA
ncbi:PAS domain-containing protein [Ferrovibrio sp.]|uniref:PAS domain-containing protein n=1 Tax=Ferrovibrio sp. TaxID=1917215 RepID=UPI00311EF7FE